MTALIKCTDDWFRALEDGHEVCTIFFDYRKAFDSVPDESLLLKLANIGVDNCLLVWLHDYLCNRVQSVVIDGTESDAVPVLSGVPQGSVLGPPLFLIYVNDLPDAVVHPSAIINLFADDILLYHTVSNIDDFLAVQESINSVE